MAYTDTHGSRGERVNQLAESLFRRGLAMTMSSARQLAESMVETESRVQQKYQEHTKTASEVVSSGSWGKKEVPFAKGFGAAVPSAEQKARAENVAAIREKALHGERVAVHDTFETPKENGFAKGVSSPHPVAEEGVYLSDSYGGLKGMMVHQAVKTPEPVVAAEPEPAAVTSPVSLSDDDFLELITDEKVAEPVVDAQPDEYVELDAVVHHHEPGDEEIFETIAPVEQDHAVVEELSPTIVMDVAPSQPVPEPVAVPPPAVEPVVEAAPPVAAPPVEEKREDLAKKHGVDLFNIFGKK